MKTKLNNVKDRKVLEIRINYENISEIYKVFDEIFFSIAKQELKEYSGKVFDNRYSFKITSKANLDYREELINGNWCQVFKSKMNLK